MGTTTKLEARDCEAFRLHIETQERARFVRQFGEESTAGVHSKSWPCTLVVRRKYICADVGSSGRYMIDRTTGEIWGIKGYGKVHRSYSYGTVETPEHWPGTATYTTGQPIPLSETKGAPERREPATSVDLTAGKPERMMSRDDVIHFLAQAAINIDAGFTVIERGSRIHQALHTFCNFDANPLREADIYRGCVEELAQGHCCETEGCDADNPMCDVGQAKQAIARAAEARV
jgi:hypothetical protein